MVAEAFLVQARSNLPITHEELLELLAYDPVTGFFTWKRAPYRNKERAIGKRAGGITSRGYWRLSIKGVFYFARRLAWFYVYGVWPVEFIDHVNKDTLDNRLCNLREATPSENASNSKKFVTNSTGFVGVRKSRAKGKFEAWYGRDGKMCYAGIHSSAEEAAAAYDRATAYRGDFALPSGRG